MFQHPCEGEAVCKLTNEKVRQRCCHYACTCAFAFACATKRRIAQGSAYPSAELCFTACASAHVLGVGVAGTDLDAQQQRMHLHSCSLLHHLHDKLDSTSCVQIPYFNAPIFLENKTQIGKVEEVFGKIQGVVRPPHCCVAR